MCVYVCVCYFSLDQMEWRQQWQPNQNHEFFQKKIHNSIEFFFLYTILTYIRESWNSTFDTIIKSADIAFLNVYNSTKSTDFYVLSTLRKSWNRSAYNGLHKPTKNRWRPIKIASKCVCKFFVLLQYNSCICAENNTKLEKNIFKSSR